MAKKKTEPKKVIKKDFFLVKPFVSGVCENCGKNATFAIKRKSGKVSLSCNTHIANVMSSDDTHIIFKI